MIYFNLFPFTRYMRSFAEPRIEVSVILSLGTPAGHLACEPVTGSLALQPAEAYMLHRLMQLAGDSEFCYVLERCWLKIGSKLDVHPFDICFGVTRKVMILCDVDLFCSFKMSSVFNPAIKHRWPKH